MLCSPSPKKTYDINKSAKCAIGDLGGGGMKYKNFTAAVCFSS